MSFLDRFSKPLDEWQQVDKQVYAAAYDQFGGSLLSHPLVIDTMSQMAEINTTYFARYDGDQLLGALPTWGKYLAGDKRYLKKIGARSIFDTGNAEMILPLKSTQIFSVKGFSGQFISELHQECLPEATLQKETLSLTRSFTNGDFSSKFRYNRRRELKKFQEDGGEIVPFDQLDSHDLAAIYTELFWLRWGKQPKGHARLEEFLSAIRPLVHGHLLTKDNIPVAIQLIFIACNGARVSAEYINGGVDPQFKKYSPGSILSFLNIQYAEQLAVASDVPLRFSFGITDNAYKNIWCDPHPLLRF